MAELGHQLPQQREAHAHHGVVVALDPRDEGAAEAVDRERTGDVQRLAGGDVRRDLVVVEVGEVDDRGRGRRGGAAVDGVAQAVTRVQHARPTAHVAPAAHRFLGIGRLAVSLPVELEHRVAAEHQRARREVVALGDGGALELGELERQLGRREPVEPGLVDARDDHHRLDAGAAQGGQSGGGGRGEDQDHGYNRARAVFNGSSPREPRSSAARWKAFASKAAPARARASSRASSQIRSPTLYDGAWPGQPR